MTLCLVQEGDKLLLGMKKRGLGSGRWNGFGGKVHEGETIEEAAKRETFEEAGIEIKNMERVGNMDFLWEGRKDIFGVSVFKVLEYSGFPKETEEMKPQWFSISEIPYENMWPDDKYWIPLFLQGKKFDGRCLFDEKDNILDYNFKEI